MREYNTNISQEIYEGIKDKQVLELKSNEPINLIELVYSLIKYRIRAFIIDDYFVPIKDKSSILEALYYQIGLFDMYDLNWDAFQEALENYIKDNACGVVLIFRKGIETKNQFPNEFEILEEIVENLSTDEIMQNGIILS